MASNFTTFFDKLLEFIATIAKRFPYFERVASLAKSLSSTSLQAALCNIYVIILRFFHSVVQIFVKPDGSKAFESFLSDEC